MAYYYSFFTTPYTAAAHKHTNTKKAKIHLKYDLKYKKDMNTNIKAHSSARYSSYLPGSVPHTGK